MKPVRKRIINVLSVSSRSGIALHVCALALVWLRGNEQMLGAAPPQRNDAATRTHEGMPEGRERNRPKGRGQASRLTTHECRKQVT